MTTNPHDQNHRSQIGRCGLVVTVGGVIVRRQCLGVARSGGNPETLHPRPKIYFVSNLSVGRGAIPVLKVAFGGFDIE